MANPIYTGAVDFHRRKLGGLFNLGRLNVADIEADATRLLIENPDWEFPMVEPNYLYGVEVEVENVRLNNDQALNWIVTEDGSLRNNGFEFVSRPTKAQHLSVILHDLHRKLTKGYKFSPRCSTHIHMNVRDINIGSLYNIVLLYQIFEKAMFKWVGHNRDKNIFCVPLYDCDLPNSVWGIFQENPADYIGSWSKYTAMNLLPITGYGTIEFRHLEGTENIGRILTWVNMLSSIKLYAQRHSLENIQKDIIELNTDSHYLQLTLEVFGDLLARELIGGSESEESFCNDMSSCVAIIKKSLLSGKRRAKQPNPFQELTNRQVRDREDREVQLRVAQRTVRAFADRQVFTTTAGNAMADIAERLNAERVRAEMNTAPPRRTAEVRWVMEGDPVEATQTDNWFDTIDEEREGEF